MELANHEFERVVLEDEGLRVVVAGRTARSIPYHLVDAVRLVRHPDGSGECEVSSRAAGRARVRSSYCVGLGRFHPQNDAYAAWVEALHRRIEPHRDGIAFVAGRSGRDWVTPVSLALSILVGAGIARGAVPRAAGWAALLALAVLVVGGGALSRFLWRVLSGSRRRYDPTRIPAALLP